MGSDERNGLSGVGRAGGVSGARGINCGIHVAVDRSRKRLPRIGIPRPRHRARPHITHAYILRGGCPSAPPPPPTLPALPALPTVVRSSAMSVLSLEEVERIAQLAHLELTDDEKQLFARQLANILTYAEQVQS